MAPQYDRQLIIGLQRDDIIIDTTATFLARKNQFAPNFKSQILWLDRATSLAPTLAVAGRPFAQLEAAIEQLTQHSRLYLTGHGDDTHLFVGGWRASELANLLCTAGLRRVKTVSLVACGASGNPAVRWDQEAGAMTFASQLANKLALLDVETNLYARCYRVGVHEFQVQFDQEHRIPTGHKFAFMKQTRATEADAFVHKRPHSKIMYRISRGTVDAAWVDYPDAHGEDAAGFNE
jgi:hypothetical protein